MFSRSRIVASIYLSAAVMSFGIVRPAAASSITVMTYNTHHGGLAKTPPTTDAQIALIAAQNPDVVVLQEAYSNQLKYYVNGLNNRLGTTAWHGAAMRHCKAGTAPTCGTWAPEVVMVLTRLKTLAQDPMLIWANDNYFVARGAVHMAVATGDGTRVDVFGCHLPANKNAAGARLTYVATLQSWAQSFPSPRLIGGDFNDTPDNPSIGVMTQKYNDAWAVGGVGPGYTHTHDGTTATTRIDYWFADVNGTERLSSVRVVGSLTLSDHLGVVARYSVGLTLEKDPSVLLDDTFPSLVSANWPFGTFTSAQEPSIALAMNGTFAIGPLKSAMTGSLYNGLSTATYNLSSNGYAYVQLIQPPNTATTAYAMFAAGSDGNNFYRWYESGNALVAEKKIAGTKKTLINLPYSGAAHQFLQIRREANSATGTTDVVFETAPDSGGVPGTFTVRYREAWDTHVAASGMRFELKAGTSVAVTSPGTVVWDNFRAGLAAK